MLQSFPANMDLWAHQHKQYKLVHLWLYFWSWVFLSLLKCSVFPSPYFGLLRPLIVGKVKVKE